MPQGNSLAAQANSSAAMPGDWFGMGAGNWSVLANIATIAGVVIALFGGYVALRTYRNANQLASHAHMHALFRDYLRTQFDFELGLISLGKMRDTEEARERLACDVVPLKLYVLEEMWAWLNGQRRRRDEWRLVRALSPAVRRRKEANDAWAATILSHIDTDMNAVLTNLEGATDCYSMGFLEFLATGFDDEEPLFRAMYEDQQALIAGPEPKPRRPYALRDVSGAASAGDELSDGSAPGADHMDSGSSPE